MCFGVDAWEFEGTTRRKNATYQNCKHGVGFSFSKPSGGKEAWSFMPVKVLKPSASKWSRWSERACLRRKADTMFINS
jgi:hypothetical protein